MWRLPIREPTKWQAAANVRELVPPTPRRFHSPHQPIPRTHLLSNGSYAVMITAAGSGYSRWRDLAVTRWREDATCDSLGHLHLPSRRAQRRRVVGGLPTERSRAGQLRGDLLRGSRRNRQARRHDHDHAGSGGLARGRRRGSPRVDFQSRNRAARDRADLVCRDRVGARRGRRRASGLLQAVRADGVRRRRRRDSGDAAAAVARRAAGLGGASRGRRRRRRGRHCNSRPIARASSDADAAFARRSR